MNDVEAIANLYVFRSIERQDIEKICALAPPQDFPVGSIVFKQGDVAAHALMVVSGRLEATVEAGGIGRRVGEIGPGEVVGEQALFHIHGSRSATVAALQDSRCLVVTPQLLTEGANNPAVVALETYLLGSLARRIRSTNRSLLQAWKEAAPKPGPAQAAAKATAMASSNLLDNLRRLFGG